MFNEVPAAIYEPNISMLPQSPSYILCLPCEIQLRILHCCGRASQWALRQTCSLFRSIIPTLNKRAIFKNRRPFTTWKRDPSNPDKNLAAWKFCFICECFKRYNKGMSHQILIGDELRTICTTCLFYWVRAIWAMDSRGQQTVADERRVGICEGW